jgi:hypothetical protein
VDLKQRQKLKGFYYGQKAFAIIVAVVVRPYAVAIVILVAIESSLQTTKAQQECCQE